MLFSANCVISEVSKFNSNHFIIKKTYDTKKTSLEILIFKFVLLHLKFRATQFDGSSKHVFTHTQLLHSVTLNLKCLCISQTKGLITTI